MATENKQGEPSAEGCGYAGPGAEHRALARFEGTWRAEVKLWFDPKGPPSVSTGTMKNTMVLGGRFLQQDYQDDAGMFAGKGFWGYNEVDGRYEGFWVDGMTNMFQIEYGRHDAAKDLYEMSGTLTQPSSGRPMKKRSVIRYLGPEANSIEMFFQPEGDPENKVMEIQYKRA